MLKSENKSIFLSIYLTIASVPNLVSQMEMSRWQTGINIFPSLIDPVLSRPIGINDDFFDPKEAIANSNDQ